MVAALDSLPLVVAVQALFGVAIALYSGAAPAVVAELFPAHSRSRWSSIPYALAAAIFGSFAPFIAVALATQVGFLPNRLCHGCHSDKLVGGASHAGNRSETVCLSSRGGVAARVIPSNDLAEGSESASDGDRPKCEWNARAKPE